MVHARNLGHEVFADLSRHYRPLLTFHLFFVVLGLTTLTPLSGWLLAALIKASGQVMVSNDDLLFFVVTPLGLLWLLLSATLAAVFIFIHHAGMMMLCSSDAKGKAITPSAALWRVGCRLPGLLQLAGLQVAAHLMLAAPFLACLGFAYRWLLADYDIYYVINAHPPELWQFAGIAAVLMLGVITVNGTLYLRWIFALPVFILEQISPAAALKRSARLTLGSRKAIAFKVLLIGAVMASLPFAVSLLFDSLGELTLKLLPERYSLLIPVMVLLIACYALLGLISSFIAVSANSLTILRLYNRCRNKLCVLPLEREPRAAGFLAWSMELLLVLLALGQIIYVAQAFDTQGQVKITAHRGSSMLAPENSLSAIEQAILDGADYVELDVRETSDGVLVLLHDKDLRRLAKDPRDIWNVPYDELQQMEAGAWFDSQFYGEQIPRLIDAIAVLRGRAKLYLEIKTSPQSPELVQRTVALLQAADFIDDTLLAALSPDVLHQVRALEPGLRTSLLVHTAIGSVEGQPFEALALRDALVNPARANQVRRYGHELHVWTVNDRRAMGRYIDMGVDNIITDKPDVLAELLQERAQLSSAERLLLRIRNWVW